MGRLVIVVGESGGDMDSGCIYNILEECRQHGHIIDAHFEVVDDNDGHIHRNDLMTVFEPNKRMPQKQGRC